MSIRIANNDISVVVRGYAIASVSGRIRPEDQG